MAVKECGIVNKSSLAIEVALDHCLALIRLTDAEGPMFEDMCFLIPCMFIHLGRENDAYDFLLWWKNIQSDENEDYFGNKYAEGNIMDIGTVNNLKLTSFAKDSYLPLFALSVEELLIMGIIKIKFQQIDEKKETSEQIQEIFDALKSENSIVWKLLIDFSVMEEKCKEEIENFRSYIDENPLCDVNKAMKLMNNCSFAWKNDDFIKAYIKENIGTKETLDIASKNAGWADHIDQDSKYKWFLNCYCLRLNDDFDHGYKRGVYADDLSEDDMAKDFMIFCSLAVKHCVIPVLWDWNHLYEDASIALYLDYSQSEAVEDWGLSLGPNMMKMVSDTVYECEPGSYPSVIEEKWKTFDTSSEECLKDIGGIWNGKIFNMYMGGDYSDCSDSAEDCSDFTDYDEYDSSEYSSDEYDYYFDDFGI